MSSYTFGCTLRIDFSICICLTYINWLLDEILIIYHIEC